MLLRRLLSVFTTALEIFWIETLMLKRVAPHRAPTFLVCKTLILYDQLLLRITLVALRIDML